MKLIAESAVLDGAARLFDKGSTMIITIGATLGKVGYLKFPASSNQQITAITFDSKRVFPKFAAYQLKHLEPVLQGIAPNTTLPILNQQEVGYFPLGLPTPGEQRAIAAFLDHRTTRIDALIAKVQESIKRMQEYRTALISAAVTGKIDVRQEAA